MASSKTESGKAKLHEQTNLLELLVTNVKDYAIFALNLEGDIATWNEGAKQILGWESSEAIGRNCNIFYVNAERAQDELTADLNKASTTGRMEYEGWRNRKDATKFWGNWVITPLLDGASVHAGYAIIVRDLTERQAAAETLRQSDEEFRLMVASVKDYAIFLMDPSGIILTWNEGAQRIKYYTAEEAVGKHFGMFYPTAARDVNHPDHELKVAREQGHYQEEGWRVRKDGSQFWASVTITPVKDQYEHLRGFIKVTRDMTDNRNTEMDRENARKHAIKASELKSQFVANVSHEIRTPMAGIIGMAEELVLDTTLGETQRDAVDQLYKASLRLLKVLNDILDFSKLEAGKILPELAPMNVRKMIEEVTASTAPLTSKKGLTLTSIVDPAVPQSVVTDETRVRQILLNLAHNAAKFTEHGGITIGVTLLADRTMKICVKDTGIGIPESAHDDLFQPFVQVDGSTRRKFGGTGLGLSIAKKYVELLQGTLNFESTANEGSEFWFTIPLEPQGSVYSSSNPE